MDITLTIDIKQVPYILGALEFTGHH